MKLLFIIDNYTNILEWKNNINIVKRWILYNINNYFLLNKLEKIKIVKTYPSFSEYIFINNT